MTKTIGESLIAKTSSRRPPLGPKGIARVILYSLLVFGYGLLANVVFLASAAIWVIDPKIAYEVNSKTAYFLWSWMQDVFEKSHGGYIEFSGDELPLGESAIVISNHVSYSDYYFIQAAAKRAGMLPYQRYFAKYELQWLLPIFGLSLRLIGMVMVKRDWVTDERKANQAFSGIKENELPVWLVSYLEGTRVSPRKIAESQAYAQSHKLPILENCLLPRTKGFIASVKALRETHVQHVYDFTIAYTGPRGFQDASSLMDIHSCTNLQDYYKYRCHVRRYALADLPTSDEGLARWAEQQFVKKDAILQKFRSL